MLGPGSCSSANWVSEGPLESGIQQALSKCTRGAVPGLCFSSIPGLPGSLPKGFRQALPSCPCPSRYRRHQSCPQDRGEGRGWAPNPQHSPGVGPALQGGGSEQADPSPSWAEPWSVCLGTVDWVDSSLPVTSWEISRIKFARFPKMILQQIHSKLRLEFQTHKSVFAVSHTETPYGSGLHKNSF